MPRWKAAMVTLSLFLRNHIKAPCGDWVRWNVTHNDIHVAFLVLADRVRFMDNGNYAIFFFFWFSQSSARGATIAVSKMAARAAGRVVKVVDSLVLTIT